MLPCAFGIHLSVVTGSAKGQAGGFWYQLTLLLTVLLHVPSCTNQRRGGVGFWWALPPLEKRCRSLFWSTGGTHCR
ncbi:hypothetical protein M758_1G237300 [Ceratodon purpureus]|nr:hypothetical protein M758_1G237300 [Ceratodon purpureus]